MKIKISNVGKVLEAEETNSNETEYKFFIKELIEKYF